MPNSTFSFKFVANTNVGKSLPITIICDDQQGFKLLDIWYKFIKKKQSFVTKNGGFRVSNLKYINAKCSFDVFYVYMWVHNAPLCLETSVPSNAQVCLQPLLEDLSGGQISGPCLATLVFVMPSVL